MKDPKSPQKERSRVFLLVKYVENRIGAAADGSLQNLRANLPGKRVDFFTRPFYGEVRLVRFTAILCYNMFCTRQNLDFYP